MVVTSYGREKNRDDEIKKHSRTNPDVQFKEFSLTKQKIDPERTMSELEKPFLKKSDQNQNNKKQKINVKMPLARKKHWREM